MAIKRIMVSVPEEFLKKVDNMAKDEGYGRSEFIRQAIRCYKPINLKAMYEKR